MTPRQGRIIDFMVGLGPPEIRAQVRKIAASRWFSAAERMVRLLSFAVEQTLEGRSDGLKEYLLGVEVFDRSDAFDPRLDPIVRVEARRLRAKLKSYYESDGRDDVVVVEFPTGTYVPRFHHRDGALAQPGAAPASGVDVAVLPFTNLSPEPDTEYFSDGLTEDLIHALTRVEGLRVVAWNSAARMKDRLDDFAAIGRELKVNHLLQGSVRQSAGRLRITARLAEVASGCYLWSESYDRRTQDLLNVQEEIARSIATSLSLKMLGGPCRTSLNLAAYDLYLRGRHHWNKRTPEGLHLGIRHFRESIAVDGNFAAGYAGLADAYSLCADFGVMAPGEAMPQAKAAALRALEIEPQLAEAHASLGLILSLHEWRWIEAGEHYRRAIELNPGYATAHHWHACDYLALLGRQDKALVEMELAVRLDPLSQVMHSSLAYVFMLLRRYEDALRCYRDAMALEPDNYKTFSGVGRVLIQQGRYAEAVEQLEKSRTLAGYVPTLLGALGQALALMGDRQAAGTILAQLSEISQSAFVPGTAFAAIHLGLNQNEKALDRLELGCQRHELSICSIRTHPLWDPLQSEPRFQSLLRTIGLNTLEET